MMNVKTRNIRYAEDVKEKLSRLLTGVVVVAAFIAGGVWVLSGSNNVMAFTGDSQQGTIVSRFAARSQANPVEKPYVPPNGVCVASYEGPAKLFVQGAGEEEGYRWTASFPYEDYAFTGTYTDSDGAERPCDRVLYEKHQEQHGQVKMLHGVGARPGGPDDRLIAWGVGDETTESLHYFHGESVLRPDGPFSEGDSLGSDTIVWATSRTTMCHKDSCVDGVLWKVELRGEVEGEVIVPAEERLTS